MTARALLDREPRPRRADIREAISGQICRCTGYTTIVRSVQWAAEHDGPTPTADAETARERVMTAVDEPTSPRTSSTPTTTRSRSATAGCCARRTRGSSAAWATTSTTSSCTGMLHLAILRSPVAHARIVSIDTSAAQAHPKVKAVVTGADLAEKGLAWMPTLSNDVQAVLATDKVRFQGQEVAFVVAEDRYSARDALELIDVEYEMLPTRSIDVRKALAPDAPVIRDDLEGKTDNHCFDWETGDEAATEAVFAKADVVVTAGHRLPARAPGADGDLRLRSPTTTGSSGKLTLWSTTPGAARAPHALRAGRRPARAQDPGHRARHRRRLRQQGADLPRLRLRDRRLAA